VIQVVDVENWTGYADTSYTAKLQAKYTDLIILNKHEVAGPRREEEVIDRIRDVADDTPIVKADQGWVDKDVVFGIDSSLARGFVGVPEEHDHEHSKEVDVLSVTLPGTVGDDGGYVDSLQLEELLKNAPKDEVYRIKGIIRSRLPPPQHPDTVNNDTPNTPPAGNRWVLNWAFGRWRFTALKESSVFTEINTESPLPTMDEFPPSQLAVCEETEAALKKRKGSIEVMVQTSIKTTVEEKTNVEGECARLSFVLARGEGERWKTRLESGEWIKYDRREVMASVEVVSL
jgi:hypothetical protein